jgi:hypothetical protein
LWCENKKHPVLCQKIIYSSSSTSLIKGETDSYPSDIKYSQLSHLAQKDLIISKKGEIYNAIDG